MRGWRVLNLKPQRLNTGRKAAGRRHTGTGVGGGGRNQMLLGRPVAVRLYTASPWASCLCASSRLDRILRWHRLQVIERLPIMPGAAGGTLPSFLRVVVGGTEGKDPPHLRGSEMRDMILLL